jgi:hypothetical protein
VPEVWSSPLSGSASRSWSTVGAYSPVESAQSACSDGGVAVDVKRGDSLGGRGGECGW